MRKHNFTTTTRGIHTTNSKKIELTYSSKIGDSRRLSHITSNAMTIRKQIATTIKAEPMSTEKEGTRKRTRNSTALRNSNYQEKEYIISIIENYAREVIDDNL